MGTAIAIAFAFEGEGEGEGVCVGVEVGVIEVLAADVDFEVGVWLVVKDVEVVVGTSKEAGGWQPATPLQT